MARRIDNRELAIDMTLNDTNFNNGINNVIGGLGKVGKEADGLKSDFNNMGSSIKSSFSGIGNKIKNSFDLSSISKGVAGLGAVLGTVAITADNLGNKTKKLELQLGSTAEESEKLAKGIERIYEKGYGESLDEVFNVTALLKQNFSDLSNNEVEGLTEKILAFSGTFDKDFSEVIRAIKGGVEGFGEDAETVLTNLVSVISNSGDRADDLLDTFAEYPQTLNRLGKSLEQTGIEDFTDILIKSGQEGVFNYDKVGDLLKEISVVVNDDSFIKGIQRTSAEAINLREQFIEGKINVIDFVSGLSNEFNKLDLKTQSDVATDLFRTMGEDIGGVITELGNMDDVNIKSRKTIQDINSEYSETIGITAKLQREAFKLSTSFSGGFTEVFGGKETTTFLENTSKTLNVILETLGQITGFVLKGGGTILGNIDDFNRRTDEKQREAFGGYTLQEVLNGELSNKTSGITQNITVVQNSAVNSTNKEELLKLVKEVEKELAGDLNI